MATTPFNKRFLLQVVTLTQDHIDDQAIKLIDEPEINTVFISVSLDNRQIFFTDVELIVVGSGEILSSSSTSSSSSSSTRSDLDDGIYLTWQWSSDDVKNYFSSCEGKFVMIKFVAAE